MDYVEETKLEEFIKKFNFPQMIKELEEEFLSKGINERKESISATLVDVLVENNNYVYVLSDGRKITEIGLTTPIAQY